LSLSARDELNEAGPAIQGGRDWFAPVDELLFGRTGLLLGVILWTVAIAHPPHGLDLSICWMKATTGLPCPGCGMMRSLSCTARGMFAEAWHYHPFGPIWLAVATMGAASHLMPNRDRRRADLSVGRHSTFAGAAYAVLVGTFLLYGLLRALIVFTAVGSH